MALIIVDAKFRSMQALYGDPPFVPYPDGEAGGTTPTCTPKRGEQTVEEWYEEQEARHGKYAEMKASRPKRSWLGGKKEERGEQEALQLPARQQPQLTVQDQLRQQRQIADTSGVTETETKDGIFWFVWRGESKDA